MLISVVSGNTLLNHFLELPKENQRHPFLPTLFIKDTGNWERACKVENAQWSDGLEARNAHVIANRIRQIESFAECCLRTAGAVEGQHSSRAHPAKVTRSLWLFPNGVKAGAVQRRAFWQLNYEIELIYYLA